MKTKIGGQAVIEGVMMRGESSMALSVRDDNGTIRTETTRLSSKKPWYRKVPFLRGIINLFISTIDGFKIIERSADVAAESEIDTSDNGNTMGGVMFFSVVLGLALAVGLFIVLPTYATKLLLWLCGWDSIAWLKSLFEGVFKMLVLIVYMSAISRMNEIRRVFMYHGAEHKTIACFENELPLTVENVRKCSRYHDRCGTSFIVFVVVLSVVLMLVFDILCTTVFGTNIFIEKTWLRALVKIALLPFTAGVSYEMLMLLARSNFILFRPLKWLGKEFQKLTTREPDDGMIEVAITSFNKVLEMDADQTIPEVKFPDGVTLKEFRSHVEKLIANSDIESSSIDWILCAVLGVKRNQLKDTLNVPFGYIAKIENYISRVAKGEPLQYVLGNTEFYGRVFALNNDVLIPRMETELVCEQAIKNANENSKVLDLCCGSGVIGETIALEKKCNVTLSDISKKALFVAKYNAKNLGAKAKLVESNMFDKVNGKFDLIVSNPPYIESNVVDTLDSVVKDYEPRLALDGGEDGLKFYRVIATESLKHLQPNGVVVLEIGYNQGESVAKLFADNFNVEVKKDYGGNDRIVIAKLK